MIVLPLIVIAFSEIFVVVLLRHSGHPIYRSPMPEACWSGSA